MPISNASFTEPKDVLSKLQKLMKVLDKGSIEAHFTNERGDPTLSREYVEMIFQDYAIAQQNPQVMNKWIALDTKLDKALLEYTSDVKMLIASVTQTGIAQQATAPVNMPSPLPPAEGIANTPEEDIENPQSRELPVTR